MRTALTIAGSDSSGGAGIQADLKTFAAHGVYGMSAITAITAQNTQGVTDVAALSPAMVRAQIAAVVESLREFRLPHVVLDTVMIAKSRAPLLAADAVGALRDQLLPMADVITPNVPEAEALTGLTIASVDDLKTAAKRLVEMGARAALVKGGHLVGPAIDVLWDGRQLVELTADRIDSRHTHGTGCTLSSAIAARLALGDSLADACRAAKAYVTRAIQQAPGLGHGHGPLQHFPRP